MIIVFHSTEERDYYHHLELKFKWRKKSFLLLNYLDRSHREKFGEECFTSHPAYIDVGEDSKKAKKQELVVCCLPFGVVLMHMVAYDIYLCVFKK